MNKASKRTIKRCKYLHHKMALWLGYMLATSPVDFFVSEGLRSDVDQNKYYKKGTSKLDGYKKRGRHQDDLSTPEIDSRAIDIYYVGWTNKDASNDPRWTKLYEHGKLCANKLGIKLVYGFDWGWDKPHYELEKGE